MNKECDASTMTSTSDYLTTTIKVAHITTAYQSIITILDSLLRQLDFCSGIHLTVISAPPTTVDSRKPACRHISVQMCRSISPASDLKSIYHLYQLFRTERFDIVHSHTAKAGIIVAIAGKLAGVPKIYHTSHGLPFYPGQRKFKNAYYRLIEKFACRFRDHLFTQNKHDLIECERLMGTAIQASCIGNGVDIERLKILAKRQLEVASRGYLGGGFRVLLLSRLEPVKRVEDLFFTIEKLKESDIDVTCVVAGSGELDKTLKTMLHDRGLVDHINMIGFTNHPHGLIKAADVVMLCSEKEGIPRSIMEAMALKKAVVTTDVVGTQELVVDGETGFLVGLGDIDGMVNKLKTLAADTELRNSMGQAGFKRVSDKYNDNKVARSLVEFYELDLDPGGEKVVALPGKRLSRRRGSGSATK